MRQRESGLTRAGREARYHVVYAEGWDDAEDECTGAARCVGSHLPYEEAANVARMAEILAKFLGWGEGRPYITDAHGRRAGVGRN